MLTVKILSPSCVALVYTNKMVWFVVTVLLCCNEKPLT